MTDKTLSVSVIINAPVERVWSLLIEHQQFNKQEMTGQEYFQSDPAGPPVTGQVIHTKVNGLHLTIHIDHAAQTDPPYESQTVSARMTFLWKDGELFSSWLRDTEHHHIQTQGEIKHPWCSIREETSIYCIAINTTSCVIVYMKKSEMTVHLLPRWLSRRLDNSDSFIESAVKEMEAPLQIIKEKVEQIRL